MKSMPKNAGQEKATIEIRIISEAKPAQHPWISKARRDMGGFLLKLVLERQGWAVAHLSGKGSWHQGWRKRERNRSISTRTQGVHQENKQGAACSSGDSLAKPKGSALWVARPLRFCAWDLRIQLKEDRLTEKRHTVVWYSFIFEYIYLGHSCSMQDLQSSLWHSGPLCGMWGLVPRTGIEPQSAES